MHESHCTIETGSRKRSRRTVRRGVLIAAIAVALTAVFFISTSIESVALAAQERLTTSRARRAIARTAGIELPTNAVEVEQDGISVLGSSATVEAKVKTAFRLRRDTGGDWEVAEIRVGENRWEDVTLLRRALDREKTERARAELETLHVALEAFRRERGHYPPVATNRELVDHLSPRYLSRVIRLDPWQEPYGYTGTLDTFRLRSAGTDRALGTADDITLDSAE